MFDPYKIISISKLYPHKFLPSDYAPSTPPPPPIPVDLWCDVSAMFQGRKDITGTFELKISDRGHQGKTIESEVRCKNSMCTPKIPGPSNACMYICGAVKCT